MWSGERGSRRPGAAAMACGLIAGCDRPRPAPAKADSQSGEKAAAPSKVSGAVKEADLAKLERREQAEKRLGVVAVEAKRQPVARAISYGGEAMIPPGRLISVASPFLGMVEAPPAPGTAARAQVDQGQPIFVVRPICRPRPAPRWPRCSRRPTGRSSRPRSSSRSADRAEAGRERGPQEAHPPGLADRRQANHDVAETALQAAEAGATRSSRSPAIPMPAAA